MSSEDNTTTIVPQEEQVNNTTTQENTKKLEGEELLEAIRKQVEYYFSRQNLNNDPFLVSHMNKDMFVPVEIIAGFKMMKTLTEDPALIVEAIKSSTHVTLDETSSKIKPNFTVSRNTVILRDIPSSTPEEEVKQIFDQNNLPQTIRSDIGDTWFIGFETDEQALEALDFIRGKTFQDKTIQARIKSDNLLKSSYPATQQQGGYPAYPRQNFGDNRRNPHFRNNGGAPRGTGGPRRSNNNNAGPRNARVGGRDYYNPKNKNGPTKQAPFVNNNVPAANVNATTGGSRPQAPKATNQSSGAAPTSPQQRQAPQPRTGGQAPQSVPSTYQKGVAPNARVPSSSTTTPIKKGVRKPKTVPQQPIPTIDSAKNFPPLPSMPVAERSKTGYCGDEYIKYNKQVVLDAYATVVKDLVRPTDLPADCDVLRTEPHAEMVLMSPPDQGVPVVDATSPESVMESTMISFAEAAITARDIKTPEISNEHLLPHRKRRNSNVKASDIVGRKRGDSRASPASPAAASGALIRPEPHRPEPKKMEDKQQKPVAPKKDQPAAPKKKAEKPEKVEKAEKPAAIKEKKPVVEKKESPVSTATSENKAQSSSFSYASILQQNE